MMRLSSVIVAVGTGTHLPATARGDDDLMVCQGDLVAGADGQATFRINAPSCAPCASCPGGCTRSRVNEVVMTGDVVAPSAPVQACLYWSRRACNRAIATLYGLPLAGLTAGVLAGSGAGGANVVVPAIMTLAGLLIGLVAGRRLAAQSAPRVEIAPLPPHMFSDPEDPGIKP